MSQPERICQVIRLSNFRSQPAFIRRSVSIEMYAKPNLQTMAKHLQFLQVTIPAGRLYSERGDSIIPSITECVDHVYVQMAWT
jgi:hypothetical protein